MELHSDRNCAAEIKKLVFHLAEEIASAQRLGLEVELFDGQENRLSWTELTAGDVTLRAEVKRRY